MHDVVICGAGAAGMTAAVYAARKNLDLVVITKDIGGQTLWSVAVENYLGYTYISGQELVQKFQAHVDEFGIEKRFATAARIVPRDGGFIVETEDGAAVETRTVLVATGKSPRMLGVPGEQAYIGKGVAYCSTCDAPLFSGLDVIVVGGGNAALDAAIQLSGIATHVTIVALEGLTGDEVTRAKVIDKTNVEVLPHHTIAAIAGDTFVTSATVRDVTTEEEQVIPVRGVFVEIGQVPNSGLVDGVCDLNEWGEIVVNCTCETSQPGIFAAGDVTSVPEKQIIIAAGEGAKALLSLYRYIITH